MAEYELVSAVRHGDLSEVTSLIKNNIVDINSATQNGTTAMHTAAEYAKSDILEVLIYSGADVNCQDVDDETPLFKACERGRKECARILLGNGANASLVNLHGFSPLMTAAENGHLQISEMLVAAGVDVFKKNNAGRTAEDIALEEGYTDIADIVLKAMDDNVRPKLARKHERDVLVRPWRGEGIDDLLLLPSVMDHSTAVHARYLSLVKERERELFQEMKNLQKKLDAAEAHRTAYIAAKENESSVVDHSEAVHARYEELLHEREKEMKEEFQKLRAKIHDADRRRQEVLEEKSWVPSDHSEAAAARYREIQEAREKNLTKVKDKLTKKLKMAELRREEHLEEMKAGADKWNDDVETKFRYDELVKLQEKISRHRLSELQSRLHTAESRHHKLLDKRPHTASR